MEFNPLDLLASAAELQQRHDEPSSNMTQQRKATTLTSKIITINSVQKENKDANKSSTKNNGVIIVKKIKMGASSDLEKMLDEHNYGNAKKGIKLEKPVQTILNDNSVHEIVSSVPSDREHNTNKLKENETSENVPVTKTHELCTNASLTSTILSSTFETVNSCIYVPPDTSDLSEVKTKPDNNIKTSSSEKCHNNETVSKSGDIQVIDVPSGYLPPKLPIQPDSRFLQTDNLESNKTDSRMRHETSTETNTETKNTNTQVSVGTVVSVSSDGEVAAAMTTDSLEHKKDTVKLSPDNTSCIEKSTLNKNKNIQPPVMDSVCDNKVTEMESVRTVSEITESHSGNSVLGKKSDLAGCQKTHLLEDNGNLKQSVTFIRSLLTSNNISGKCVRTAKLQNGSLRVNCDTESYLQDLKEKIESCESPKSRLELDPFCNSSPTGIHLLSPDRRNPDSVGIVESPVTSAFTDSSNSYETETDTEKDENSSLSPTTMHESSKVTLEVYDESILEGHQRKEISNEQKPEKLTLEESKTPQMENKKKIQICVKEPETENQTGSYIKEQESIFRFESDHCYAGLPGNIDNAGMRQPPDDDETDSEEEEEEEDNNSSASASPTEMSQDSGYGDIPQSPDIEKKDESNVRPPPEKLVPVLISFNKSGSLTVHTDKGFSKELPRQIFTLSENQTVDSNANLLNIEKAQNLNKPLQSSIRPLLLSPIGKGTASVLIDPSKILIDPKSVNSASPQAKGLTLQSPSAQDLMSPKFRKFRIGTFASFSNTGMDIDSPVKDKTKNDRTSKTLSKSSSVSNSLSSFKSPGVDRTFLRQVSSSSVLNSPVAGYVNHIQHDHDYCLHSLMPSTVDSAKENNQKDYSHKNKSSHVKTKKNDSEFQKNDKTSKGKGKRIKNFVEKEDSVDEMELLLDEERYRDLPSFAGIVRAKTRTEKYIEQKSSEPKMKITGSSNFQDQFVYFMNTKKRSRRRESRDGSGPSQIPFDNRIPLPPHKPGDIIVPHLTDADIEHLKLINKQNKTLPYTSHSGNTDSFSSKATLLNSSQSASSEINTDEESKIINTILSLENENLTEEQVPYSESMELDGQNDIMSLLPEQMNLTQEQMDLLFSAVDEVQNSSPGLVSDKLAVGLPANDPNYTEFPVGEQTFSSPVVDESPVETGGEKEGSVTSAAAENTEGVMNGDKEGPQISLTDERAQIDIIDRSSSTSETKVDHAPSPKGSENSVVKNGDNAMNATSDSGSGDKATGTQSEAFSETGPKQSFTSLSGNSGSDSAETSLNQTNSSSLAFSSLSNSVNPDLPLPTLDKASLDILGSDYRLDKSELFSETTLPGSSIPSQGGIPGSTPVITPYDYNAPWIVTVSMYWNDLPAVMINNLPYIRLVDIHKQILPAKDTGILKKRCQLMGIEVGNCTEMQRYFLVQYGRAVNSKSTLIVSKDAAKVLIGYYVDPQPAKCLSAAKEHKSIIEHRREQLRRIALAKRAALRAEKLEKERALEAETGNNLLKPIEGIVEGATDVPFISPRPQAHNLSTRFQQAHTLVHGTKPQRSTRHKKINFLELLRGDSSSNAPEEEQGVSGQMNSDASTVTPTVKPSLKRKRSKISNDGKVKVVKYTESESSEMSEESASEYTGEDSSDSGQSEKVVVVKPAKKKRTSLLTRRAKRNKYKKSVVMKRKVVKVPSFKVKYKSLAKGKGKQMLKHPANPGKIDPKASIRVTRPDNSVWKKDLSRMEDCTENEYLPVAPSKTDSGLTELGVNSTHTKASVEVEVVKNVSDFHVSSVDSEIASEQVTNLSESDHNLDTNDEREHAEHENSQEQTLETEKHLAGNNTDLKSEIQTDLERHLNEDSNCDDDKTQVSERDEECLYVTESNIKHTLKDIKKCSLEVTEDSGVGAGNNTSDHVTTTSSGIVKTEIESIVKCKNQVSVHDRDLEIEKIGSGKSNVDSTIVASDTCAATSGSQVNNVSSENVDSTAKKVNFFLLNNESDIIEETPPVRIVHRDVSPLSSSLRSRRQLGEVFVEHYNNKRSFCIRCYTCRKMMSVDHFMRHLHDVSGGLITTDVPQIIEPSDSDMTDSEYKSWEVFQRKKELFDNNQLPSDVVRSSIVCNTDTESSQSFVDKPGDEISRGPIIIQTPVSPVKTLKAKAISKPEIKSKKKISVSIQSKTLEKSKSWSVETGIRASSRKRKASQLFSSDDYTFDKKLPRLQNELKEENESKMDYR